MRTGLIAKKIGMSNYYTPNGINIPVTVLHIESCKVVERISDENSDVDKLVIGANEIKKTSKLSKSVKSYFEKKNINPLKITKEFSVDKSNELKAGDEINADHFEEGQFIDVSGFTKGKGFAGVMKRHNFGGLRASHGVSISHRSHGSTGQCQDPGRVFKGKKKWQVKWAMFIRLYRTFRSLKLMPKKILFVSKVQLQVLEVLG
jgi:large subunit ribosomal protein L3